MLDCLTAKEKAVGPWTDLDRTCTCRHPSSCTFLKESQVVSLKNFSLLSATLRAAQRLLTNDYCDSRLFLSQRFFFLLLLLY